MSSSTATSKPGRTAAALVLAAGVLCCALGLGGGGAGAWGLAAGLDADPVLYPKDRMGGPVEPSSLAKPKTGERPRVSATFWWAVIGANALLLALSLSLLLSFLAFPRVRAVFE